MSKIEVPTFPEKWTSKDLLTWINSQTESPKELLAAVDGKINEVQKKMDETKRNISRMREEESVLEACGRLCFELRDRLKMVVDAQAKEQLAKEFDAIAVFDKADSRAAELANIIMARKAWNEGVSVIESLEEGEPAPENIVFSLQESYTTLSKYVKVDEREKFLEKVKDIFLSWYSTRVVLALQSDSPTESLLQIKQKYDKLCRTDDFNGVVQLYISDQIKLSFHQADSLPDLFIDVQNAIISNFTRLREGQGWAEKVLHSPSDFIATALSKSLIAQWSEVHEACNAALNKSLDEDPSGALTLRMILTLRQQISDVSANSEEDRPVSECIRDFGARLLTDIADDYSKLATSFLAAHSNISVGTGTTSSNLELLSSGLSQLIKESDYLLGITEETFDSLAIFFVIPAFRSMYENLISLFSKFYKTYMEKSSVKDADILRLISLSGQMLSWVEKDKKRLKEMLEAYDACDQRPPIVVISNKLAEDIAVFEKKISAKAEGDLGIAKARAELRKLNRRFVAKAVDLLTVPIVANMEASLRDMRSNKPSRDECKVEMPSFGTTPNEFVTAAGVALLSLAHQLSAYSQDTNMAASLAFISKLDNVDDIPSWWIGKCAASVQDCFIAGIGEVGGLPPSLGRQFAVDYAYLADVFEDLGTVCEPEFDKLRRTFIEFGYMTEQHE